MIPAIRNGILAIEGTGSDVDDDMSGDEKQDNEVIIHLAFQIVIIYYATYVFSMQS